MPYQTGEIYFIREQDGANLSSFVKVGLVRYSEGRDSFNRLMEHQTGNPRKLLLDAGHVVKTEAVDMVEAQLHRLFARHRINGEWFKFESTHDLNSAVDKAKELAKDAADRVQLLDQAELLREQPSDPNLDFDPSPELEALALKLALAKEKSKRCKELLELIKDKFVFAYEEGADVSGVAKTTTRTFKPKLDLEALFAAHPAVRQKYEVLSTKLQATFSLKVKGKALLDADREFLSEIGALEATINEVTEHHDIVRLNEPQLELLRIKGLADWDEMSLEAQLKIALGQAQAITGICSWKRVEVTTYGFDEATFAEENPDLAKSFMIVVPPKTYVIAEKKKAN